MSAIVVDDDPEDLVIIGRHLHALGLDVSSASTVAQARQLLICNLRPRPFQIAFVDVKLIGSSHDGIRVLRDFRNVCPAMPVVMITGYADRAPLEELFKQSYFEIAFKPLEPETLLMILDQHKIDHR